MVEVTVETQRFPKERIGVVVRAKMQRSVIVEVTRLASHHAYRKVIKHRKRFMVHDEKGTAKVGDKVRIIETKPMSRLKRWRIVEVLEGQKSK